MTNHRFLTLAMWAFLIFAVLYFSIFVWQASIFKKEEFERDQAIRAAQGKLMEIVQTKAYAKWFEALSYEGGHLYGINMSKDKIERVRIK